jgi:hypothetical protein
VATAIRINDLIFAAFLTTFITSLVTTVLIAYRIYAAAKQGLSKRRFRHVVNIVVQSGALYCLAILVSTVAPVLPGQMDLRNTWNVALNYYTTALVSLIAVRDGRTYIASRTKLLVGSGDVGYRLGRACFDAAYGHHFSVEFHSPIRASIPRAVHRPDGYPGGRSQSLCWRRWKLTHRRTTSQRQDSVKAP